jgi:hypothetical protein
MIDLMIDIETMGTGNNPVMIQLAGVYFNRYTGELGDEFCKSIDMEDCLANGFEKDPKTEMWWSEQNQDVLKAILDAGEPTKSVMQAFSKFGCHNDINIWSHATFDFVIVQHYLNHFNLRYMPFRNARDIRTLVDLSGIDLDNYDWSKGKTHNALDDCKFQIAYSVDAFNALRKDE